MAAKKKQTKKGLSSEELITQYLSDRSGDHFNFEEEEFYKVSTGSLLLDIETGGGLGPGLHRFCGVNEGGKTSEALEVAKNFQKQFSNGKVIYFKTEGRFSPEMRARCGIDTDETKFFMYESNIYESVFDLMKLLILNNDNDKKYLFIIDSLDGLIPRDDIDKPTEKSSMVAGGAVIASTIMKKVANQMTKRGHMAIFVSQVRADIRILYTSAPVRQTTATGGNALLHFANWIFDFQPRFNKDLILQKDKEQPDRKTNKILGHKVKIMIKKSPNEKSNYLIEYPVRYGRTGGKSIWIEKEIADLLIEWDYTKKSGPWLSTDPDVMEELKEVGLEMPEKIQGRGKLFDFLEANPDVVNFFFNKFKNVLSDV